MVYSLLVSVVLTGVLVLVGKRVGALDGAGADGHQKSSVRKVPNIGGVAIFWGLVAGFSGAMLGAMRNSQAVFELLNLPMLGALVVCLAVLHVVGLVDDRKPLGALPKMAVMLACALVFPVFFDVRLFELFDAHVGGAWLSVLLTAMWFVGITNAMNFMDNMDGLSGGTSLVASAFFLVAALTTGQWAIAAILLSLIGSLGGFLVFNKPKASIFMGDGGSLVIGFVLAFLTVRTTYFDSGTEGAAPIGSGWYAVFMPLCVLAVPVYDLVAVSVVRLSQGKSPLVGDEQHLSHRLRARGLSVWQTLAVIVGLTAVTGCAGIMLANLTGWAAALGGVQVVLVLMTLAVLEFGSRKGKR